MWDKVQLHVVSVYHLYCSMFGKKSKNLQMRTAAEALLEVEIVSFESHCGEVLSGRARSNHLQKSLLALAILQFCY